MKKKMNNKGFSLVELIVVIAIMGVLVGVLAPQFIRYIENSRRSTDVKNGQEIAAAIQAAMADERLTGTQAAQVLAAANGIGQTLTTGNYINPLPRLRSLTGTGAAFVARYDSTTGSVVVLLSANGTQLTDNGTDCWEVFPQNGYTNRPANFQATQ